MALFKLPSLEEVIQNPSLVDKLPLPMAQRVLAMMKTAVSMVEGAENLPPDPVSMALKYPKYRWMDARHLHFLSEQVAQTVEDCSATIVCMPPQHAKSTTVSQWTPFWALARDPEAPILLISYEANFARKWGVKAQNLVRTYGSDYNLELDPKRLSGDDWGLVTGGGMQTAGAGGGIAGKEARILIVDDPVKDDSEVRSALQRENLWEWWETTVVQRIRPDTAVFIVGTRWHEDDLIGRIIKKSDSGEGIKFNIVTLPALAEKDDPIGRAVDEGLWPDHFPQEWYEKRRDSVSAYTWSAVNQQQPSPPGGNMVDPEWWGYYRPAELPTEFDEELQSWDLSLDALKKTDSYHCGGVMSRKGALVFIRDAFHEHSDINKVMDQVEAWHKFYPKARTKLVERAISGPALVQTMRSRVPGMLAWPPKGKRKGSKEACLNACVPAIKSGNVLLPLNPDGSKPRWVKEFVEELRQFPRAPHDDYVDMFSQGLSKLLPSVQTWERKQNQAHEEALGAQDQPSLVKLHTAAIHKELERMAAPGMKALKKITEQQRRAVLPFERSIDTSLGGRVDRLARRLRGGHGLGARRIR